MEGLSTKIVLPLVASSFASWCSSDFIFVVGILANRYRTVLVSVGSAIVSDSTTPNLLLPAGGAPLLILECMPDVLADMVQGERRHQEPVICWTKWGQV
jgi:hypothetical protein